MNKKKDRIYMKKKYGSAEYFAIILCAIMGVSMMIYLCINAKECKESIISEASDYDLIELFSSSNEEEYSEEDKNDESGEGLPFYVVEISSESVYKGDLVLVNKVHSYGFKEEAELFDVYDRKNGKYKLGTGNEKLLEKTISAANDFLGDFNDITSLTNVTMVNGYISFEDQQKKYESYIKTVSAEDAQKWGVKAGASDHHTGLSFNLMLYPSNGKIGEGEYSWLTENACKYGFIIRYPEDKANLTSVLDNNHFRYVGVPHAEYIYQNNLTLEEYISLLGETTYSNPLKITSENKEYIVYYSPADSSSSTTEVRIPEGYSYSCSGDNINGLIITAFLE